MPQCFCSSLGWFSAFVLKRLRCTLLTSLLLLWMIILFKANGEKKKRKNKSAFCQRVHMRSHRRPMWKHCDYYCRFYFTTAVLLDNIRFSLSFSSFFSSSGEMSWNVKMQNDGVQRGWGAASGVLSLSICYVLQTDSHQKCEKKNGGRGGWKKTTNKIPQPIAVLAPVAGVLIWKRCLTDNTSLHFRVFQTERPPGRVLKAKRAGRSIPW